MSASPRLLVLLLVLAAPAFAESRWVVTTIAGTGAAGFTGDDGPADRATLNNPFGLTRGPDGALYFCDTGNHAIRRIDAAGLITTVAGTGKPGHAGDGGPARAAQLNEPYEVRFDKAGHMFLVEMRNHLIRRVDAKTEIISTIAGVPRSGFTGDDGPATKAQFNQPHSIQFAPNGHLYVCDIGNHRIRKIDMTSGTIRTFAGTGKRQATPDGVPFATAPLNGPRAIDFGRNGDMILALREGNAVYRLDMREGTIRHLAGTGKPGFTGHGGPAKLATLSGPKGVAIGPDNNIYLVDTESHSIRMIDVGTGNLHLIAGTGQKGDGPDGAADDCKFARPHGIYIDTDNSVYVGDSENHRVRRLRRIQDRSKP